MERILNKEVQHQLLTYGLKQLMVVLVLVHSIVVEFKVLRVFIHLLFVLQIILKVSSTVLVIGLVMMLDG